MPNGFGENVRVANANSVTLPWDRTLEHALLVPEISPLGRILNVSEPLVPLPKFEENAHHHQPAQRARRHAPKPDGDSL